jgi:N-glycosylase/DNA lyase
MTADATREIAAPEFDLGLTLSSGQVFHWEPDGDAWHGLIGDVAVRVRQRGTRLEVPVGGEDRVARYFALDHPLRKIRASFPDDAFSQAALRSCRGLRVMRQPRWECLATFLTSAMKQVAHIRAMSRALRARFGEPVEGSLVNAYPAPAVIAAAGEDDLRACGLGFRAPNLRATARRIVDGGVDLDALAALETGALREELCLLPGVGRKIANCVLLFAYERLEAVPVDVWIARVARAMAPRGDEASLGELETFTGERFGPYAGYVQQYLFHHARVSKTLPAS